MRLFGPLRLHSHCTGQKSLCVYTSRPRKAMFLLNSQIPRVRPSSSLLEPILLPKLRIHFAEFPYACCAAAMGCLPRSPAAVLGTAPAHPPCLFTPASSRPHSRARLRCPLPRPTRSAGPVRAGVRCPPRPLLRAHTPSASPPCARSPGPSPRLPFVSLGPCHPRPSAVPRNPAPRRPSCVSHEFSLLPPRSALGRAPRCIAAPLLRTAHALLLVRDGRASV